MDNGVSKNRPSTANILLSPWRENHYWPYFIGLWRREENVSITISIIFWLRSSVPWPGFRKVTWIFLSSLPGLTECKRQIQNVVIGINMMVKYHDAEATRKVLNRDTHRFLVIVCVECELLCPTRDAFLHPSLQRCHLPSPHPKYFVPSRLASHPSP